MTTDTDNQLSIKWCPKCPFPECDDAREGCLWAAAKAALAKRSKIPHTRLEILAWLQEHGRGTARRMADAINRPFTTVSMELKKLADHHPSVTRRREPNPHLQGHRHWVYQWQGET